MLNATSGRHQLTIGAVGMRLRRVAEWPLRTKLAVVLLTPTMVAVVLGGTQVRAELTLTDRAAELAGRVAVLDRVVDVSHGLQRERDAAVELATDGTPEERTDLAAKRTKVAATVAALDTELAARSDMAVEDDVAQARRQLRDLDTIRRAADTPGAAPAAVFGDYSAIIASLLAVGVTERSDAGDPTIGATAAALTDLGKAIEQTQSVATMLATGIARNGLGPDTANTVRVAGALADDALGQLRETLTPDQRAGYDRTVDGHALDRLRQLRDGALSRVASGQPMGLSTLAWRQAAQPVLDQLTGFERSLSGMLGAAVDALGVASKTSSLRDTALIIGALLLGLAIALHFAATMIRPLWTLRRRALEIADQELPGVIERFAHAAPDGEDIRPAPVEITTTEEIGQVARAFDEVHSSAVRLAAEQAALRHSVNEIFVNLSRRTQSLVHSQLKMIDGMEAEELDPDQLDRLFKLDHLATRMRRNGENLLVLAGATLRRASSQPVSVADLVRAAVSEVEQYTRVVLKPPPDVLVVGAAVSDTVHLLAELLDNATSFSPPDTEVTVACTLDRRGLLRIAVADEGVGLPQGELDTLNQQLTGAASIEAAASRRMGLFVVGRLAARRNIAVCLRPNVGAGTIADVTLPADVLRLVDDPPATTARVFPAPAAGVPRQRNFAMATVMAARQRFSAQAPPAEEQPSEIPETTASETSALEGEQPAWPVAEPLENTPIYDDVTSAWFQSAGRATADRDWRTDSDALWHTGDHLDKPVTGGLTQVGLPRRVRGALLVRGSVPTEAGK